MLFISILTFHSYTFKFIRILFVVSLRLELIFCALLYVCFTLEFSDEFFSIFQFLSVALYSSFFYLFDSHMLDYPALNLILTLVLHLLFINLVDLLLFTLLYLLCFKSYFFSFAVFHWYRGFSIILRHASNLQCIKIAWWLNDFLKSCRAFPFKLTWIYDMDSNLSRD